MKVDIRSQVPGPWGVGSTLTHWYVVNGTTGASKRIGPVAAKRTNYFDKAMAEADRRNAKQGGK